MEIASPTALDSARTPFRKRTALTDLAHSPFAPRHAHGRLLLQGVGGVLLALAAASLAGAQEEAAAEAAPPSQDKADQQDEVKLLHRLPFDRLILNAANQNAVIDVQILDIPDRRNFRPLPTSGAITVRRLSQPSVPYEVSWSAIEKVELFEEMLLAEANRLAAAGDFDGAFEYFTFLFRNYAELPGLERAAQGFLWQDASIAFQAGRHEDALASLLALHDRNPDFRRLGQAVDAIGDALVTQRLEEEDFAGARSVIDALEQSFTRTQLRVTGKWREKFRSDAATALATAQQALQDQQYAAARAAVQQARGVYPTIEGAAELLKAIQDAAPEIRVGVMQLRPLAAADDSLEWTAVRTGQLTDPRFVEMIDFGAEGGDYESRWADIESDDVTLATTLTTTPAARDRGMTAATVARRLVEMANPASPAFDEVYQSLARSVAVEGDSVVIQWHRPHIRPAAILQTSVRTMGPPADAGLWFTRDEQHSSDEEANYERPPGVVGPRFVVEQAFDDDESAINALVAGQIDVLDRVPPWQLDRLSQSSGVRVVRYRLPTVHVLLPNYANPLLEFREFRRALCYGIDRAGIVDDLLLGGRAQIGFRPVSGPFLAGENATDPIGYAYRPQLQPRPYEPRLASVLATVARASLAKREKAAAEAASADGPDAAAAESPAEPASPNDEEESDGGADGEPEEVPPPALRLAHAADPVARLACQTIKTQLDGVGIPVNLVELTAEDVRAGGDEAQWDLMYLELAVWEPIVDARRLLGPRGMAGRSSAYMNLALDEVEQAENWSQVIARAKQLHSIAHYDLPVIPLWQTVNYYACRTWMNNVGDEPVTLYQNLPQWEKTFTEGSR